MSDTIEQLTAKLSAAFQSDTRFEAAIGEVQNYNLTKPNIVVLYNRLFGTERRFPSSATKPDILNAIRRERIARVRARA